MTDPYEALSYTFVRYDPRDSDDVECTCIVCGSSYTEKEWEHDEDAPQMCMDCAYGSTRPIRSWGFRPMWQYLGGGGRTQVISTAEAKQLHHARVAVRLLEREIKCKST